MSVQCFFIVGIVPTAPRLVLKRHLPGKLLGTSVRWFLSGLVFVYPYLSYQLSTAEGAVDRYFVVLV